MSRPYLSYSLAAPGKSRTPMGSHSSIKIRRTQPRLWTATSRTSRQARVALLPLDRGGRLRRNVEHDAVDARDLVHDARRDQLDQVVRQARPVRGHRVVGRDGADDDGIAVRALVALDADGTDRR